MRYLCFSLAHVGVWLLVTAWCLLPPVLFLGNAVRMHGKAAAVNKTESKDTITPPLGDKEPSFFSEDAVIFLIGGSLLLVCFCYAVWCCVGIVCGVGLDCSVTATDALLGSLLTLFRPIPVATVAA